MVALQLFHPLIKLQHFSEVFPERRQLGARSDAKFRFTLIYGIQHTPLEKIRQIPEEIVQLRQGLAFDRFVQLANSTPLGQGNSRSDGIP